MTQTQKSEEEMPKKQRFTKKGHFSHTKKAQKRTNTTTFNVTTMYNSIVLTLAFCIIQYNIIIIIIALTVVN